jgi:hypothetical protein
MSRGVFSAPFSGIKYAETGQLGGTEDGDEPDRDPKHLVRRRRRRN